jgi:hypothetical protein
MGKMECLRCSTATDSKNRTLEPVKVDTNSGAVIPL